MGTGTVLAGGEIFHFQKLWKKAIVERMVDFTKAAAPGLRKIWWLLVAVLCMPIQRAVAGGEGRDAILPIPMVDFTLPIFGKDGRVSWEVHGNAAVVAFEDIIGVEGVLIRCFAEGGGDEIFSATGTRATIVPTEHRVFGDSEIFISGKNFCASAARWELRDDETKIRLFSKATAVRPRVEVSIDGDFEDILL
jgi:hypothetical protein